MNNTIDKIDSDYGIFSDLPPSYAEGLYNHIYYSDAFGVFNQLMGAIDTINHLDWNIPGHQDRSIQLSLDYLYPLLKSWKLKMMVPIVSLRTARTPWEYAWVKKIDMPEDYPIWFVDKYMIYSKPEEADDAVSMVLLQWEKIKKETTPEIDSFYKNLPMIHMKESFYTHLLSFTLPDRPFWKNGDSIYD